MYSKRIWTDLLGPNLLRPALFGISEQMRILQGSQSRFRRSSRCVIAAMGRWWQSLSTCDFSGPSQCDYSDTQRIGIREVAVDLHKPGLTGGVDTTPKRPNWAL